MTIEQVLKDLQFQLETDKKWRDKYRKEGLIEQRMFFEGSISALEYAIAKLKILKERKGNNGNQE